MAILHVARLGHPVLREKASNVPRDDLGRSHIQGLIDDMLATMADYRTLGLAAPQVRQHVRIIVANVPLEPGAGPTSLVIVNPEITVFESEPEEDWEGCASLPDVRATVLRARSIAVRGIDRRECRCRSGRAAWAHGSCSTGPIIWTACCSSIG